MSSLDRRTGCCLLSTSSTDKHTYMGFSGWMSSGMASATRLQQLSDAGIEQYRYLNNGTLQLLC